MVNILDIINYSTSYSQSQTQKQAESLVKLITYYEIFEKIVSIVLPIILFFGIIIICTKLKEICDIMEELLDKTNDIDIRLENLRTRNNENMEALLKMELIKNKNEIK